MRQVQVDKQDRSGCHQEGLLAVAIVHLNEVAAPVASRSLGHDRAAKGVL